MMIRARMSASAGLRTLTLGLTTSFMTGAGREAGALGFANMPCRRAAAIGDAAIPLSLKLRRSTRERTHG